MTETTEKPGLEERYTTAANTSNLRVEAEKGGDADIIIAAGWNQIRIGGALLRLHTEFDGSPRPRLASREDFLHDENRRDRDARKAASRNAHTFNLHEMALHLQRLKSLPDVRAQIALQLVKWGAGRSGDPVTRSDITQVRESDAAMLARYRTAVAAAETEEDRAEAQAALSAVSIQVNARRRAEYQAEYAGAESKGVEILQWWLAPSCGSCGGTKFQVAEGTGRQTAKLCQTCKGLGTKDMPGEQDGRPRWPEHQLCRRMVNWLDQCVEQARANMGGYMRSPRGRADQAGLVRIRCAEILKRNPNDEAARKVLDRMEKESSAVAKRNGEKS